MSDFLLLVLLGVVVWQAFGLRRLDRRITGLERDRDSLFARLSQAAPSAGPATQPADADEIAAERLTQISVDLAADAAVLPGPEAREELAGTPWAGMKALDEATKAVAEPAPPPPPRQAVVFTPERAAALTAYLRRNWVYVVSAASLALAGLFLVQYGIEKGYLTPLMRVLAALALGAALVGVGERLRRRHGTAAAALPATFSGAGLVVIFAAILAARQIYGLIGPVPTLIGLVATGLGSIALGWLNGALLIGLGLLGAAAAPFLTAGGGTAPAWLYGYFALVAVIGLGVDTLRRLAWVSVLGLALAYLGGFLALQFGAGPMGWSALLIALPVLATVIPERGLLPRQEGPSLAEARFRALPVFPVRLVLGSLALSSAGLMLLTLDQPGVASLAMLGLTWLVLAYLLWAASAPGLADAAALPALGWLAGLALMPLAEAPLYARYADQALPMVPPESPVPQTVTALMIALAAMLAASGLRALRPGALARWHAVGGAVAAGLALGLLQVLWTPDWAMGAFPWAALVMAIAAVAAGLALALARQTPVDPHRVATLVLLALSAIALSLGVMASGTPFILALSVLVVVAAGLDRRFDLPEMTLFLQGGVAVLTWLMLVDPGIDAALNQSLPVFLGAFLGPVLAGGASLWLIAPRGRPVARAVLDSATVLWAVLFLDAGLLRWLNARPDALPEYLAATLMALPWIAGGLTQTWRAAQIAALRRVRRVVAGASLALGLLLTLLAVGLGPLLNPARIDGPLLLDSLALAYLVPGAVFLAAALRLPGFAPWLRKLGLGLGCGLAALYLVQQVRRFWWGDPILLDLGVQQGELYTYTVVLMILGAGLLMGALARHSSLLRRAAMAVIALTIAKVFLWDAAGLTGLTRVISFLGLGLSLAGLAWLNGVVDRASRAATAASSDRADPPAGPAAP